MVKLNDILPSGARLVKIVEDIMKERVKEIKSGKRINRSYSTSTANRRRKFGLPANKVRLWGSSAYSGKSWRMLESWSVVARGNRAVVRWTRDEAGTIYEYQKRRYGKILETEE